MSDIEVNPKRLKHILSDLVGKKDFILIDAAAGIDNEVKSAIEAADEVMIVTNPHTPAIADALRAKKLADDLKKPVSGIILNKVRGEKFEIDHKVIEDVLETPVIARISEHRKVRESVALKIPMTAYAPRSKITREIKRLSHHITGEEIPNTGFAERLASFFYK